MGIPHLFAFLSPYATRFELQPLDPSSTAARGHSTLNQGSLVDHRVLSTAVRHGSEASGSLSRSDKGCSSPLIDQLREHVVVDGPGLAFHAYYKTLAQRSYCKNALDAMPPYEDVIGVALEWLATIETYGFTVRAIYFDGYLPERKKQVRLERLHQNLQELSTFRNLYTSEVDLATRDRSMRPINAAQNIFSTSQIPARLSLLPASPFLVPAVIEALCNSEYSEVTRVVPGEADEFCAAYLKSHGGIVLTADSDLLVHDLGHHGSVILFKDLEITEKDNNHLRGSIYHPASIARRLNLKSLLPFAYSVHENHHRTFTACLQEARLIQNAEPITYELFANEYRGFSLGVSSRLHDTIRRLDPRIAEWVCQVVSNQSSSAPSERANEDDDSAEQELDIFLPILIEDPTRTPAWAPALPIRQLGYSALRAASAARSEAAEAANGGHEARRALRTLVAVERWRRGNGFAGTAVRTGLETDVKRGSTTTNLETLGLGGRDLLPRELLEGCLGVDAGLAWRLIGVWEVCRVLLEGGRVVPERSVIGRVVKGGVGLTDWDWGVVHFWATVQGVLYSWRMVRQILDVVEATNGDYRDASLWQEWRELHECLKRMPTIAELFPKEPVDVEENTIADVLDNLYNMLDIQAESSETATKSKKKKKKWKKRQNDPQAKPVSESKGSSNMYSLLAENG